MRGSWSFLIAVVITLSACAGPPPDVRSTVTREQIDGSRTPLLFAEIPDLSAAGRLRPLGSNDDVVTWQTSDNLGFSFRNGVLVSTRGLGFDLMSADVAGTLSALDGASGDYERFHSYLDGENQTEFRSFVCTMAAPVAETIDIFGRAQPTQRHDEVCRALGLTVENSYWTGNGTMWKARQWVGDRVGYLMTETLKP